MNILKSKKFIFLSLIIIILIASFAYYYFSVERKKQIEKSLENVPSQEDFQPVSTEELEKYNSQQLDLYNWRAYNANDYDSQISSAELLIKKSNGIGEAYTSAVLLLASAYLNKGSLSFQEQLYADKAIELLNDLVKKDDKNSKIYAKFGYAYEIKEDYQQSIENYNRAIALEPNESLYYVKRGHAYDLMGDLVKAKSDYEQALNLDSNNCAANMHMARIYLRYKNYDSAKLNAENVFYNCVNSNDYAVAGEILGNIYLNEGLYDRARDYFKEVLAKVQSYYSFMKLAVVEINSSDEFNKKEKILQAEEYIEKSLGIYPDSAEAYYVWGEILDYKDEKLLAKEKYQKADSLIDSDITLGSFEKEQLRNVINSKL